MLVSSCSEPWSQCHCRSHRRRHLLATPLLPYFFKHGPHPPHLSPQALTSSPLIPFSPSPPEDLRATVAHISPIPIELVHHFSACTAALGGGIPQHAPRAQTIWLAAPPMAKSWCMLNYSSAGRALQCSSHDHEQTLFPCIYSHRLCIDVLKTLASYACTFYL